MAGIVRTIDRLGRLVLPVEFEETMGVGPGTDLEVLLDGDAVVLRRYEPGCVFCGEMEDVVAFRGRLVCRKCQQEAGGHGGTKHLTSAQESASQAFPLGTS